MSNNALIDIVIGAAVVGLLVAPDEGASGPGRIGYSYFRNPWCNWPHRAQRRGKGALRGDRAGGLDRGFFSRRRCARCCSRLFDKDLASSGRFRHEPGNGPDRRFFGWFRSVRTSQWRWGSTIPQRSPVSGPPVSCSTWQSLLASNARCSAGGQGCQRSAPVGDLAVSENDDLEALPSGIVDTSTMLQAATR